MVIDRYGELLFGGFLPDHVQVEELLDFQWLWKLLSDRRRDDVIGYDLIANVHAFIADVYRGSGNELFYVVLTFGAERTTQNIVAFVVFSQRSPPSANSLILLFFLRNDLIYYTVILGLPGGHDVVPLYVRLNPIQVLARVPG